LDQSYPFRHVKIEIFVPEKYVGTLGDALGKIGVGHIGNYDHCMSITSVKGYWRPLDGSNPYQGEIGKICEGSECKVEVNCEANLAAEALRVIRAVHPYEVPVINVVPIINELYDAE